MTNHRALFWKTNDLTSLTRAEWELLCDHCGRCCLHKFEDEDTGEILYTCVACKYFDLEKGGCRDYEHRTQLVPECLVLTPENVGELKWAPRSCAYRLLAQGKALAPWHPLNSGLQKTVLEAGFSITSFAISETDIDMADLETYILDSKI